MTWLLFSLPLDPDLCPSQGHKTQFQRIMVFSHLLEESLELFLTISDFYFNY